MNPRGHTTDTNIERWSITLNNACSESGAGLSNYDSCEIEEPVERSQN